MPLSIIGAGFGRTGTLSLKSALEQLGFAPCYHMTEVLAHLDHVPHWAEAAAGRAVAWEAIFDGYRATVDWPAASFWREITAQYPAARVILSVRSAESWYRSVHDTIYTALRSAALPADHPLYAWWEMSNRLVFEQTFGGRFEDRAHAIGVYERHNEAVRRAIAPERLLVFEAAQGWEPLCDFLGVAAPDAAFPRVNTTEEFRVRSNAMAAGEKPSWS